MNRFAKIIALLLTLVLLLCSLSACTKEVPQRKLGSSLSAGSGNSEVSVSVYYDPKFGGFYLDIPIADFNASGFSFGDSLNLSLSNGVELSDVPYFNGYYVKTNELLACGYPGYAGVKIGRNNGGDVWDEFGVDEDTKVCVTLNEAGKYIATQEALNTVYTNVRSDYPSNEAFANFRALSGGRMKENVLFRSASPVDNQYNRAFYVSALMEQNNVRYILNLADSEAEISAYYSHYEVSPAFSALYESGNVLLMSMNNAYRSDVYKQKVVNGLRELLAHGTPALIHCTEGKDRTGFVCCLIEALCGASYEELLSDYMITYDNYYTISKDNKADQYDALVDVKFNDFALYFADTDDVSVLVDFDYEPAAKRYLLDGGMTEEEISALQALLCD